MESGRTGAFGLPITLHLDGSPVLCVGGGKVAGRRVPVLLEAGGNITIVSPELRPDLRLLAENGAVRYLARPFEPGDTAGMFFVLAATNDGSVNRRVATEVLLRNGLVCVATDPIFGNCSFMSTIRRGALTIGLQTGGGSPAVAAAARRRIEASLPPDIEQILDSLASMRADLKSRQPDPAVRAELWQRVAVSGDIDLALAGDLVALERIRETLELSA
jgi:precorrin-2 dehydrogenase/sirohydrochlorin ferrochelatase